jgi:hypothetical protein
MINWFYFSKKWIKLSSVIVKITYSNQPKHIGHIKNLSVMVRLLEEGDTFNEEKHKWHRFLWCVRAQKCHTLDLWSKAGARFLSRAKIKSANSHECAVCAACRLASEWVCAWVILLLSIIFNFDPFLAYSGLHTCTRS